MASVLTRFGQYCRELRSRREMTLGDQADALNYEPSEISSIEMGRSPLPPRYAKRLIDSLGLNEQEQHELLRRIECNVVAFPRHNFSGGDKTSTSAQWF
jgi:transcriptional regulator with XRE-family HTH domain